MEFGDRMANVFSACTVRLRWHIVPARLASLMTGIQGPIQPFTDQKRRQLILIGMSEESLHAEIKAMMIDELMLEESANEIASDMPIFGPEGLGLDSVDALQLVVGIEKVFGLKLSDSETAKGVLRSVDTIAEAIQKHRP